MTFPEVLAGLHIIDLTTGLAGAHATMLLADLGAEVIVVEDTSPRRGAGRPDAALRALRRNTRSVALDLMVEDGSDLLWGLLQRSHAVVVDLLPEVAAERGLDFETVSSRCPELAYCTLTDQGAAGPDGDEALGEFRVQAASGLMHLTGDTSSGPVATGVPFASISSGVFCAVALLAYLRRAPASSRFIDISAVDSAVSMLTYMGAMALNTDEVMSEVGSGQGSIYPYNAFEASDGHIVVAPITNEFWRRFCRAIALPDLGSDPRFARLSGRLANRAVLAPILDGVLRQRSVAEWEAVFEREDVPHGAVNSVQAALDMPQTRHRGMLVRCASPDPDRQMTVPGTPFRFHFTDANPSQFAFRTPPAPGEDSAEVLVRLGVAAADDVRRLIAAGVVTGTMADDPGTSRRATTTEPRRPATAAAAPSAMDEHPLRGLKIVDFSRMFSGPMCTQLLADLGADVAKVETPKVGDATRHNLPMVRGESTYFLSVNRGKSSHSLNLKDPSSRAAILDLVAGADVVVENFRPGVMQRLGLGYDDLAAVNHDLIMCSISGFGATGPLSGRTSFDLVNQALAGFVDLTAGAGQRPVRMELPVSDLAGGMYGALAVLAALRARDITGSGCWIDLSLHDILISQLAFLGAAEDIGSPAHRAGSPPPIRRTVRTCDGYVAVMLDGREGDVDNAVEPAALDELLASRTTSEALRLLRDAGLRCSPVRSVPEVLTSDVARKRQLIVEYPHPQDGEAIRLVSSPFLVDGRRVVATKGPPPLSPAPSP